MENLLDQEMKKDSDQKKDDGDTGRGKLSVNVSNTGASIDMSKFATFQPILVEVSPLI